jgi:AcrR family transcriptional regulator
MNGPRDRRPSGPPAHAGRETAEPAPSAAEPAPAAHTGRRPGPSDTRERILEEARRLFAERGFESTTIRGVAGAAGVDPALVHHYYGTKDGLLEAALTPPVDARSRISGVMADGPEGLGERATRTFLELWEDDEAGPAYLAIVRCATSNEHAASVMRDVIGRQVLGPLVRALGMPNAQLRADLVASQFIGLAMARYLTRLEPLASCDLETVIAAVAPTVQRYLVDDIPDVSSPDPGGPADDTPPTNTQGAPS